MLQHRLPSLVWRFSILENGLKFPRTCGSSSLIFANERLDPCKSILCSLLQPTLEAVNMVRAPSSIVARSKINLDCNNTASHEASDKKPCLSFPFLLSRIDSDQDSRRRRPGSRSIVLEH